VRYAHTLHDALPISGTAAETRAAAANRKTPPALSSERAPDANLRRRYAARRPSAAAPAAIPTATATARAGRDEVESHQKLRTKRSEEHTSELQSLRH